MSDADLPTKFHKGYLRIWNIKYLPYQMTVWEMKFFVFLRYIFSWVANNPHNFLCTSSQGWPRYIISSHTKTVQFLPVSRTQLRLKYFCGFLAENATLARGILDKIRPLGSFGGPRAVLEALGQDFIQNPTGWGGIFYQNMHWTFDIMPRPLYSNIPRDRRTENIQLNLFPWPHESHCIGQDFFPTGDSYLI